MIDPNFWRIIESTRTAAADGPDQQLAALDAALQRATEVQLRDFLASYAAAHQDAYRWDLWAAAYIINGGASDDGFAYFRDWLIAQGEATYEAALANPESLVGKAVPYETEFEDFRYVATEQYEKRFGAEPEVFFDPPGEPAGEPFDEDTLNQRLPKLAGWVEATNE